MFLPRNIKVRGSLVRLSSINMALQQSRPSSSSSAKGLTHDPRPQTSHIHRLSGVAPPDAPPMIIRYYTNELWADM
jgi:hypothetical protein